MFSGYTSEPIQRDMRVKIRDTHPPPTEGIPHHQPSPRNSGEVTSINHIENTRMGEHGFFTDYCATVFLFVGALLVHAFTGGCVVVYEDVFFVWVDDWFVAVMGVPEFCEAPVEDPVYVVCSPEWYVRV